MGCSSKKFWTTVVYSGPEKQRQQKTDSEEQKRFSIYKFDLKKRLNNFLFDFFAKQNFPEVLEVLREKVRFVGPKSDKFWENRNILSKNIFSASKKLECIPTIWKPENM